MIASLRRHQLRCRAAGHAQLQAAIVRLCAPRVGSSGATVQGTALNANRRKTKQQPSCCLQRCCGSVCVQFRAVGLCA